MSSVWASVRTTCAATDPGAKQSCGSRVLGLLSGEVCSSFLRFREGPGGLFSKCAWCKPGFGLQCCGDEAVGFLCAFSVFLSWSSSCARLKIWVPFHDSPHSFGYALGREEEPVIRNKLAMLCSGNCFMVCLSWWLQEWKISLWDDVEDLCLHALSLGSSLLYMLRHPWLQSGCLKEMGFLWGLGSK